MKYLWIAMLLIVANTLSWYATNIQFCMEYWKDKPLLANVIFGLPCGLIYWYAVKYMMAINPELWSARFIAAAVSYTVFPILTWHHLGESMFTPKTMICIFFALCIFLVQIFMK